MTKLLSRAVLALMITCVVGVAFAQQDKDDSLTCRGHSWINDKLVNYCEIREQALPATADTISVDGRQNGGVSVKGWDRNEILVRAKIQASALSDTEAKQILSEVRIETAAANVFASGPANRSNHWWSVSYEVFVPRRSNLSLKTNNGGISIVDVNGQLQFTALNGGVHLKRVGGSVKGQHDQRRTAGRVERRQLGW